MQTLVKEPRLTKFIRCKIEHCALIFYSVQKTETFYNDGNEAKINVSELREDICTCPLKRIDEAELLKMRKHTQRGFVLKVGHKLYFTVLPPEAKFLFQKIFSQHLCSTCARCYARPYCDGGCEKVMETDFNWYGEHIGTIMENIKWSKRIEKYPFIQQGFQTFNIDEQDFFVGSCKYYCKDK